MKLPVLGAEFTMQDRGTTLVEGPLRRTMETVLMPVVGWSEEVSWGDCQWESGLIEGIRTSQVIVNGLSTGTIWFWLGV